MTDLRTESSKTLEQEFCAVLRFIHQKGWSPGTGGNFSFVDSTHPLVLKMAPSGVDKGMVTPSALISVDAQQQVIAGTGKASAESAIHLAIIQLVQAKVVFHSHSIFNTLLSELFLSQGHLAISGYEMLKGFKGIRSHEESIKIPIFANSQDMEILCQQIEPVLQSQEQSLPGFLIAGHGLYAWGNSIAEAKRHLEIFEFLLELIYRKLTLER